MDDGTSTRLFRQVVASTVSACESCAHPFDERAVSVIGHHEGLWFFSLTCGGCRRLVLVAALVGQTPPVASRDPSTRGRSEPIGIEDVSAVHRFLERFDGDFRSLFRHTGL